MLRMPFLDLSKLGVEEDVVKRAKKQAEQAKREIERCAPEFARLADAEGEAISKAFALYVEKLTKYQDSIAHILAVLKMRKGEDYHQHNLHIAELQGAYEALRHAIELPAGYVRQVQKGK